MLTHWNKLFPRNCTVVKVNNYTVYPIQRVGSTSLMNDADVTYNDAEISNLKHIDVLIRDPGARFVSGVNEYCRQNKLNVHSVYRKIKNGEIVDTHFVPQYVWLLNLYRCFRGEITIRPFNFIANITDLHARETKHGTLIQIEPLKKFTEVDAEIIKNSTVQRRYFIEDIIKDYKHVLS